MHKQENVIIGPYWRLLQSNFGLIGEYVLKLRIFSVFFFLFNMLWKIWLQCFFNSTIRSTNCGGRGMRESFPLSSEVSKAHRYNFLKTLNLYLALFVRRHPDREEAQTIFCAIFKDAWQAYLMLEMHNFSTILTLQLYRLRSLFDEVLKIDFHFFAVYDAE